jgi:hypothetical protein
MAVGFPAKTTYANGDVFSASDINDTNGTLNIVAGAQFAAGKNKILNSNFAIWQRGTSFASAADSTYFADRFLTNWSAGGATNTFSRQTFTAGTAPVAGYESQYFARLAATGATGTTQIGIGQRVEDVRTLAGSTVTFSFWAKADSARTLNYYIQQNFGSGGSATVTASGAISAVTTSWARYSVTVTLGAMTGKTIGTGSYVQFDIYAASQSGSISIDIWGVQLESGSTATAFQTATGTIQGELAACQRYYWRQDATNSSGGLISMGTASSTADVYIVLKNPTTMRVKASSVDFSTLSVSDFANPNLTTSNVVLRTESTENWSVVRVVVTGATQYRPYSLTFNSSTSAYVGFNAEL